nr:immunoglobulin heavy chain junction region [Macaca mulatta]
CTRKEETFDHW